MLWLRNIEADHLADRFVVSLAAFMEILDTSIANLAQQRITGNIGVRNDKNTWVLVLPGLECNRSAYHRAASVERHLYQVDL